MLTNRTAAPYRYLSYGKSLDFFRTLVFLAGIGCVDYSDDYKHVKTPVILESNREIELHHVRTIHLKIGNGPVLNESRSFVILDSTLLILNADYQGVGQSAHEFDLSGNYIRTIGERGKAPGEYIDPLFLMSDSEANTYIYDWKLSCLNVYDFDGNFIQDLYSTKSYSTDKLLSGSDGSLFLLVREQRESWLIRLRNDYSVAYKTLLSDILETEGFNGTFGFYQGFSYHPRLDLLYYAYPWEFEIKEIDANSGRVLRVFGLEFSGYRPITAYADTLSKRAIADSVVEGTLLIGLHSIGKNRLLAGYVRGDTRSNFWIVYEIRAEETLAYPIIEGNNVPFQMQQGGIGLKAFFSSNDYIYVYSPTDEVGSNGEIDVFSLEIKGQNQSQLY